MACPCDLYGHQEAGTRTAGPGDETDEIVIAADIQSLPEPKKAGEVADLRRYGDAVRHICKGLKKITLMKGRFFNRTQPR